MSRGVSRLLCRAGLLLVGLGGLVLLSPGLAAARRAVLQNPTCGSTVYTSVTLHGNMNCSESATDGLKVGANRITINLNGFEIIGPDDGSFDGVDNSGGFNNVTVRNGSVEFYGEGVYFDSTKKANISDVTAEGNDTGIDVEDSTKGVISDSLADDNDEYGVYLSNNHMVTVSDSDASDNGTVGIYDDLSLDTIDGDTMSDNGTMVSEARRAITRPDIPTVPRDGIFVDQPLTVPSSGGQLYYTIENSNASENGENGFEIEGNSPTTLYQAKVIGNTADYNGESGNGWGYYAYQQVKSNKTNGAQGNASGNCFHVTCTNTSP